MVKKSAIDMASKALDRVFAKTEQEIKNYKLLLDISPATLKRVLGDSGKARLARDEIISAVGHTLVDRKSNFVALPSTQRVNRVRKILAKYAETDSTDTLLETRSAARSNLFLSKSKQVGANLKSSLNSFARDIDKYTSPSMKLTLNKNARKRTDSLELELTRGLPKGPQYSKLNQQAKIELLSGFRWADSQEFEEMLNHNAESIVKTVINGKKEVRKRKYNTTKTKHRKKKAKNNIASLSVFTLGSQESGILDHNSIIATVNLYLADTIKRSFMKGKSAPKDPDYLRNITGRFAESARVVNIISLGGTSNIFFEYQTNPYEIFSEGGKLYSSGRDPKLIIGGAVREVMQRYYKDTRVGSITEI